MPPHEFKPCKTDIVDFPDKVEIKAELPGYKKEDLKIKVENDILVLSAKKEEKKEEEKDGVVIKKEIYSGSIQKSFGLKGLDKDNISASFMDGILTLTVPNIEKEEKKERIIEIN